MTTVSQRPGPAGLPVSYDVLRGLLRSPISTFAGVLLDTLARDVPGPVFLGYLEVALNEVVEHNLRPVLEMVLNHHPRYRDLGWALLYCLVRDRYDDAQLILDRSPGLLDYDLEQPEQGQNTILATLVEDGNIEAVRWVLEHGARPGAHYGLAAQVAGMYRRWDLLELLIQHGLDPRTVGSVTALAYVQACGRDTIPAFRTWLLT